jgi:hypothetical protein
MAAETPLVVATLSEYLQQNELNPTLTRGKTELELGERLIGSS